MIQHIWEIFWDVAVDIFGTVPGNFLEVSKGFPKVPGSFRKISGIFVRNAREISRTFPGDSPDRYARADFVSSGARTRADNKSNEEKKIEHIKSNNNQQKENEQQ